LYDIGHSYRVVRSLRIDQNWCKVTHATAWPKNWIVAKGNEEGGSGRPMPLAGCNRGGGI